MLLDDVLHFLLLFLLLGLTKLKSLMLALLQCFLLLAMLQRLLESRKLAW